MDGSGKHLHSFFCYPSPEAEGTMEAKSVSAVTAADFCGSVTVNQLLQTQSTADRPSQQTRGKSPLAPSPRVTPPRHRAITTAAIGSCFGADRACRIIF